VNPTPLAERQYAYYYIGKLLSAGIVIRPDSCQKCGRNKKDKVTIYGHHADYSKPDEVEWLCGSCHKKAHVAAGEVTRKGKVARLKITS
jgi:hypothetical protein